MTLFDPLPEPPHNLKAVNHNGRDKSRHFNLLKTVQQLGENNSPNITMDDQSPAWMDNELSTLEEEMQDEDGTQVDSDV